MNFPERDLERAVVARASQHGVAVDGLERYRAGEGPPAGDGRAGLVIGYGRPPEHAFTTALARLCAALPGEPAAQLLPVPYPRHEPGRRDDDHQDSVIIGARPSACSAVPDHDRPRRAASRTGRDGEEPGRSGRERTRTMARRRYGRPPGYGPPPLWTEEPYDPPGWR